jgi:signal transduction histidine kinase
VAGGHEVGEADNASINTRKDPSETTAINKGIRDLLALFTRSSYVGFTATPFANIFIDPLSTNEMLGDDLFPRDFIHLLEPPTNYVGMTSMFPLIDPENPDAPRVTKEEISRREEIDIADRADEDRANRLVCDLVDVASIDAGQLAIVPVPGDMAVLLTEVADEFRPAAAAKGIGLDVEQGRGPMLAQFDRARLFQVFGNLIANSIKFSPRDSRITLHGKPGAGELQCSVRDEGAGIPADQIELVFERFAQVEHNDRRGLGLGLFIAKRIVEAHAGRMWAQSTLGHGTSVLFTIPLG